MPNKVPLARVGVSRQGVTIYPEIGKPFDFTKEEIADMNALTAKTQIDYYRSPVNEEAPAAVKPGAKGDGKL